MSRVFILHGQTLTLPVSNSTTYRETKNTSAYMEATSKLRCETIVTKS